jgi:septum formation protein
MPLILASASPRRAELLASAGFDFEVTPADVDESVHPGEDPAQYALRVATAKAVHVSTRPQPTSGGVILAADTVVVADGRMMGKPVDDADAESMLRQLSGVVHDVLTAVVLLENGRARFEVVRTKVHFVPLTDADIRWYIATGEPMGKAGGYAIQGRAARFIDWIEGSWSNVVGLPIASVCRLLDGAGDTD